MVGHSQVQPEFSGHLVGNGDFQAALERKILTEVWAPAVSCVPRGPLFFRPGLAGDSGFETGSSRGLRVRNSLLRVVYRKRKTQVELEMV